MTLARYRAFTWALLGSYLSAAAFSQAQAQAYPSKPLRFIVGPSPDLLARIVGQKLTEAWGQQVVVDVRPGAGGSIAAVTTAKAAPDGYTLLLSTGAFIINATLYRDLQYNFEKDFAPVSLLALIPLMLVVHPALPAKSVAELVQLARSKPGQLNCASSGNGTTTHLACAMLNTMGCVNIVHVPYKGVGPSLTDLIGGQVQMLFAVTQATLPHVQTGKLRALAVTGRKRSNAVPEVPTVAESGIADFVIESWNGVHVTAGTPKAIVAKLNTEINRIVGLPDVRERMLGLGLEPMTISPDEFAAFVRTDITKWAKVVKDTGVRGE